MSDWSRWSSCSHLVLTTEGSLVWYRHAQSQLCEGSTDHWRKHIAWIVQNVTSCMMFICAIESWCMQGKFVYCRYKIKNLCCCCCVGPKWWRIVVWRASRAAYSAIKSRHFVVLWVTKPQNVLRQLNVNGIRWPQHVGWGLHNSKFHLAVDGGGLRLNYISFKCFIHRCFEIMCW